MPALHLVVPNTGGESVPPPAAASVAGGGDQVSDLDHWMLRIPYLF